MTREDITLWLAVWNFILTWGVALYMYMSNKNKTTNERVGALENDFVGKHNAHSHRITKLETAAGAAPNHADLAKVQESINILAATVNQLVGENRGQSDTLRLILNQITEKGMK